MAGDVRRKTEEGGRRQRSYLPDPAVGPPISDPEASWGRVATAAACSGRGRRSSATLPLPDPDGDFPPPSPPPLPFPPRRQRAGAVSSWRRNSPPLPLPSQNPHGGIARGGGGRRGGRPNFFYAENIFAGGWIQPPAKIIDFRRRLVADRSYGRLKNTF